MFSADGYRENAPLEVILLAKYARNTMLFRIARPLESKHHAAFWRYYGLSYVDYQGYVDILRKRVIVPLEVEAVMSLFEYIQVTPPSKVDLSGYVDQLIPTFRKAGVQITRDRLAFLFTGITEMDPFTYYSTEWEFGKPGGVRRKFIKDAANRNTAPRRPARASTVTSYIPPSGRYQQLPKYPVSYTPTVTYESSWGKLVKMVEEARKDEAR